MADPFGVRGIEGVGINVYGDNMTSNDNTVNIKGMGRYHHGDLRKATLDLSLTKLKESDRPELGLRSLARELGVSAPALYRHFPSKDALLDSLADEGLRQLGRYQRSAMHREKDQLMAFLAQGEAYVLWAAENPALFALTFTRMRAVDGNAPLDSSTSARIDPSEHPFALLRGQLSEILTAELDAAARSAAEFHAWVLVHGLAQLVLAGQIPADRATIRAILTTRLPSYNDPIELKS